MKKKYKKNFTEHLYTDHDYEEVFPTRLFLGSGFSYTEVLPINIMIRQKFFPHYLHQASKHSCRHYYHKKNYAEFLSTLPLSSIYIFMQTVLPQEKILFKKLQKNFGSLKFN